MRTWNPNSWEAETGESKVLGQLATKAIPDKESKVGGKNKSL